MLEKIAFFALGYYLGSRGARDGLKELVGLARSVAATDEVNAAAGMASSTLRSVLERDGGASGASPAGARDWWEAATR
jgi:hypothetical protein